MSEGQDLTRVDKLTVNHVAVLVAVDPAGLAVVRHVVFTSVMARAIVLASTTDVHPIITAASVRHPTV